MIHGMKLGKTRRITEVLYVRWLCCTRKYGFQIFISLALLTKNSPRPKIEPDGFGMQI